MARLAHVLLLTGCVFLLGDNLFAATGGTCPASAPSGITSCFYADYTNGSDANAGTTESAPLQHLPGMKGCTKNCSSITPSAGMGLILRGGITWPAAALPWTWTWSGTATTSSPGCTGSGCVYVGVDPTWYTGSSWARPILNAGGSALSPTNTVLDVQEPGNYIVFDNIEFTGLYWGGEPAYGTGNYIATPGGDTGIGTHDTYEHLYLHGWSHGTAASGTTENPCGITGDTGNPNNNNVDSILEYSVIDGSDTSEDSCSAVFGGPPYLAYNYIGHVTSCMVVDGPVSIHDNICEYVESSFDTSAHENGLEDNYSANVVIYNNIIRHLGSGALTLWTQIAKGSTAYMFNNLFYDTDVNNVLDFGSQSEYGGGAAGNEVFWNNTVECGQNSAPDAVCAANIGSGVTAVTLQNNHFITNAGSYWSTNGPTPTLTTNLLQTLSTANGQGYSMSETYAFSPTASTDATVGKGSSVSSLLSSLLSSAAGIVSATVGDNDTTYGVLYNTTNHTVTSPGRTTVPWKSPPDIGAYSYGIGPGTPLNLNGSAVPQ